MGKSFSSLSARLRSRAVDDSEAGLSLVELMFAMVIFAIVAASVVAGLEVALKTARIDRNRVAAADLAARELEITRNEFNSGPSGPGSVATPTIVTNPHQLPAGTAGSALVVDNVPYTVVRNVEWLPAGTGQSPCDGGSAVTYPSLAVNVTVSWPAMGSAQPVVSNTVLTPPKGTLSSTLSFVAVKVLDSRGVALAGQTVTLTGPGATSPDTTAADGCAVFAVSTPGSYVASINQVGYVDFYGNQNATKTVVVGTGTFDIRQINYDRAAALTVTMTTQGGYSLPTALPWLTFSNSGLTPSGIRTQIASGSTTTVTSLWPFTDGYTLWAGACSQADPAASGGTRSTAVVVPAGASASTTTTLAPVQVTVRNALGLPLTNATVLAYPAVTTTCATTENPMTLGVTDGTGLLKTSVPAGAWKLQISGRSPSGAWPTTPVLLPTSGPTSMVVTTT